VPSADSVPCDTSVTYLLCNGDSVTVTGTCKADEQCVIDASGEHACVAACTPSCPDQSTYCKPVTNGCNGYCPAGNYCDDPLKICVDGECVTREVAVQVDDVVVVAGDPVVLSPGANLPGVEFASSR